MGFAKLQLARCRQNRARGDYKLEKGELRRPSRRGAALYDAQQREEAKQQRGLHRSKNSRVCPPALEWGEL